MSDPIEFYRVTDSHGEFSNCAAYPIRLRKKVWPTSEHYFQAMKFYHLSFWWTHRERRGVPPVRSVAVTQLPQ